MRNVIKIDLIELKIELGIQRYFKEDCEITLQTAEVINSKVVIYDNHKVNKINDILYTLSQRIKDTQQEVLMQIVVDGYPIGFRKVRL